MSGSDGPGLGQPRWWGWKVIILFAILLAAVALAWFADLQPARAVPDAELMQGS